MSAGIPRQLVSCQKNLPVSVLNGDPLPMGRYKPRLLQHPPQHRLIGNPAIMVAEHVIFAQRGDEATEYGFKPRQALGSINQVPGQSNQITLQFIDLLDQVLVERFSHLAGHVEV